MPSIPFKRLQRWSVLSLLNLVIVSLLGALLRYKIALPLPGINYNFLLHAHSHFAFSGWLSTAIFIALVYILYRSGFPIGQSYTYQFYLSQISSFGMLITFYLEGYGEASLFFSTLSIFFSWWFTWQYWKDTGKSTLPSLVKKWVKAALLFFVLSGAGPFLLGYSMSHKPFSPNLYQNALYLFLHFQYNGWFSFGVMALFFYTVYSSKHPMDGKTGRLIFGLMAIACIPGYCLSLLWMDPPTWIFVIAGAAALLQLMAMVLLLLLIVRSSKGWLPTLPPQTKLFWELSLIAFIIKLILQSLSVIPSLGRFAFGFRMVIVGYLHLVMLGFLSFFLLGYFLREKILQMEGAMGKYGSVIFISGVLLNEILLVLQALTAIEGADWAYAPYLLLIAAVMMLAGLMMMLLAQVGPKKAV